MAYNEDAVLSKLSALTETHESIATTAQWIMFHRRHAAQTVHLWLTKLKDLPSPKRLNMIYLANEVTQQSKARNKDDFLQAFSPFIADATALSYKGASSDIQNKLRRVVDVWRERKIFPMEVQDAIDSRLRELDSARSGGPMFGSTSLSTPAATVPPELAPLVTSQQAVTKSAQALKTSLTTANSDYSKLMDPVYAPPQAPVYAARLNGLLKNLANAEGAVTECIKTREELISALEKMLNSNRQALDAEQSQLRDLGTRKTAVEEKKQAIELSIIGGLPHNAQEPATGEERAPTSSDGHDIARPQVEALTPPHVQDHDDFYDNHPSEQQQPQNGHAHPTGSAPGIEMLSALASQYESVPTREAKKRKIDETEDFPDVGIDADVAEMVRKESTA
ncbi:RNA polymerase II-binding domain-containing protein [Neurospora tetraspora]|uniref:RNA polymerase II-binding domain-containing protein n=1 Tax=Neurospora tetraspora TaxID=94610 RepID=A0AAE0JL88_9PEZI|nr:RNA polymerase II-binding domain-containing protein [Neurospora tetraspora]